MARERKRREMQLSAVFDIETSEWDTFVAGAIYRDGSTEIFDYEHENDMIEELMNIKGTVYAHFGGGFDFLWALDRARETISSDIILRGSLALQAKFGDSLLRDSYALAPMSLAKFSGGTKDTLGLECQCGQNCGGYCRISRMMNPADHKRMIEYLSQDVKSLWDALEGWEGFCAQHNIDVGATIGASAWQTVRRTAGLPPSELVSWSDTAAAIERHKWMRQAYFGGRTEVYQWSAAEAWEHDVHSMYPAMLAYEPMPLGAPRMEYGVYAAHSFEAGKQGIYTAIVNVPEMDYPPLPIRRRGRLYFPTGSFGGRWADTELKNAIACGAQVKIIDGLVYPESGIILRDFVEHIFELERVYPEWKHVTKYLRNSLTGKFGTGVDHKAVVMNPARIENGMDDINGRIFTMQKESLSACGHLEWAIFLTAAARVKQQKQLSIAGNDAIYGDTDSVYSARLLTENTGDGLGEYSKGKHVFGMEIIAPKVYSYRDSKGVEARAKGISLKKGEIPEIGRQYPKKGGVKSLISAARAGEKLFVRSDGCRTLARRAGGRVDCGLRTRPPRISEVPGEILTGE